METFDKKLLSLKKLCLVVNVKWRRYWDSFSLYASKDGSYYKITQKYDWTDRELSVLFEEYEDAVIKIAELLDYVIHCDSWSLTLKR